MIVRQGLSALLVAGSLSLAACNPGGAPAPAPSPTIADGEAAGDYGQRIRDLPEGQRSGVFLRAIRDGRQECQEISRAYEIAAIEGRPAWAATCDNDSQWIIAFADNGMASVTKASPASRLTPRE